MPLIKIETRPKEEAGRPRPADDAPARPAERDKPAPVSRAKRAREARQAEAAPTASGAMKAVVGGALAGLVLIAGIGAFLFARQTANPVGGGAVNVATPGAVSAGQFVATAPSGPATAVPPLNPDYSRDAIIATVGSQPYKMADLESAVRVAHALAFLTGEQLTPLNDPGIRDFQIQMLKRQVDMILMKQAMLRENIAAPTGDIEVQIDSYLSRIGSSRQKLGEAMANYGVTEFDVKRWFEDSRTTTAYVVEKLLKGKDISQREAVTKAWLDQEWKARESDILINFYEPSASLAAGTPPATAKAP